jgi:hypothetical protein
MSCDKYERPLTERERFRVESWMRRLERERGAPQ